MCVLVKSGFKFVSPKDGNGTSLMFKTRIECLEGVLPVSKGGTGIHKLVGSKMIASSVDGTTFEEIDVPVEYLSGLKENVQDKLSSIRSYSLTIPTGESNWVSETVGYSQTFTVSGILETDNPIIGLQSSSLDNASLFNEQYAYGCIDAVTTGNNTVTIYCFEEIPGTEITISISCI